MAYSRFAYDVTKIQTEELLILLRVNVLDVLPHHNISIYRNFHFERVLRFTIKDG